MKKVKIYIGLLLIGLCCTTQLKAEVLSNAVAWWPYGNYNSGGTNVRGEAAGSAVGSSMLNACRAYKPEVVSVQSGGPGACFNPENRYQCVREGGSFVACVKATEDTIDCATTSHPYCDKEDDSDKDDGCSNNKDDDKMEGNPCNVATGNKFQTETDFSTAGFTFTRSYNSRNLANLSFGLGWRHNYQKALIVDGDALTQVSSRGRGEPWAKVNGSWVGDADSKVLITEDSSGFLVTKANGATENFDTNGRILSETDTNGHQTTYSYSANGKLEQVTNHYGHSISFTYQDKNILSVTDALGLVYKYEYDNNNNLAGVRFPDETPAVYTDNPRKIYHYEKTSYPHHLTGITDENGDRYATFAYQSNGKAISTEHAQTTNAVGQERIELDFQ